MESIGPFNIGEIVVSTGLLGVKTFFKFKLAARKNLSDYYGYGVSG
jgi:hypothetical protein